MARVDVNILGRDYSMACSSEEEETLLAAVAYVNQRMQRIQAMGKVASSERIAVMAALQIAAELLCMKAPDGPLSDLAVGEFKHKIASMKSVLEDALSGQEKLL